METLFSYLNISIGLFTFLLFCYFLSKKARTNAPRKPPEAAGGWPVIGHLPLLKGSKLPHITLSNLADKYGPIFTIRIGMRPSLVISSWEMAKECYTTHDSAVCSRPENVGGKLLAYNFAGFAARRYDSFSRAMRKITASELLSNRRMELLGHIRASEVKRSVKELHTQWKNREKDSEQVVVDMDEWVGNVNLNVVLMMVCGKRLFGGSSEDERQMARCRKCMKDCFHLIGQFVVGDAIPFLKWLDLGGYEKAMKKTAKEMDSLVGEWLEEHRRKRERSLPAEGDRDFMDVMFSILEDSKIDLAGYDADTVNKATCMTLVSGGTDTITISLIWALALLLNNREALKKAQEELDTHVGNNRLVEESDLSKLVYLKAVLKEALRLYPVGPLSGPRVFSQDCTVGGYHVPAGTRLITNLWKIQRDPRAWPEPLEFKPERFLSGQKDIDFRGQNFEFLPFGCGRRICPGMGFGFLMMQLVLGSLVHSMELTSPLDGPLDMTAVFGLTIHRANPLHALVKPRLLPCAYE